MAIMFLSCLSLTIINRDFNPYNRQVTFCKPIVIKDRVWIGINITIYSGITIVENSIIAAGSVVTKDVPPMLLLEEILHEY